MSDLTTREGKAAAVGARLAELRLLEAGWLGEGAGAAVSPELFEPVERIALAYIHGAPEEADFPRIFPTPEGGLQVEILGSQLTAEVFQRAADEVPAALRSRPRMSPEQAEIAAAAESAALASGVKVVFTGFGLDVAETVASDDESAVGDFLVRAEAATRAKKAATAARTAAHLQAEEERVAALASAKGSRAEADTVVPAPVPPEESSPAVVSERPARAASPAGHQAPPTLRREER